MSDSTRYLVPRERELAKQLNWKLEWPWSSMCCIVEDGSYYAWLAVADRLSMIRCIMDLHYRGQLGFTRLSSEQKEFIKTWKMTYDEIQWLRPTK